MKKIVIILVLLFGVQALYAQRFRDQYPQTEVSVSYSFYPRLAAEDFLSAHFDAITGSSSP